MKNRNLNFFNIKNGFTLAEVLITLVIVGVVAAFTIPTVINNTKKNELHSRFKKAVSMTSQAIQKMKVDNGDIIYDYTQDSELDFRNKFIKYFSLTCTENCLNSSKYKNYANLEGDVELINNQLKNCVTVQDGVFYCFYKGYATQNYYITFDINGDKSPNRWGYDVFTFYIERENQILKPVTLSEPISSFYCNNTSATHNGAACGEKALSDANYFKNLP